MQNYSKKYIQQLTSTFFNKERLYFNTYDYQSAVKIIAGLQKLNVQQLYLNSLHLQKVLHPFLHIDFQYLLVLDLSYNFITSIEFLIEFNAPNLTYLRIQENHITQTKPLRKCHFPKLQRMRIQNNHLRELNLSECNFAELRELDISNQGISQQDLIKVSSRQLHFVRMQSNMREKHIVKILKSRFEDIEVVFAVKSETQDLAYYNESHETDS